MSTTRGAFVEFENGESLTDAGCDSAWYASLTGSIALPSSSSYDYTGTSTEADHVVCRVFCLANLTKPGSGTSTYVIDDTVDWRDRLGVLLGCRTATAMVPGHSSDSTLNANTNKTTFYTGAGETAGQASVPDYGKLISTTGWWIYADDTTGALKIDAPTGASAALLSGVFQVIAGPRLNEKVTITTPLVAPGAAVDDESVKPTQLNWLQDSALMRQSMAEDSDTLPLGPECFGNPPIPSEWTVRGEVVRQPVLGQAWRYFTLAVSPEESRNVDTSIDWRDRMVTCVFVANTASAGARLPGGASDDDISETDSVAFLASTFYTGPGEAEDGTGYRVGTGNFYFRADPEDGALYFQNGDDTFGVEVVGMVFATPPLGPRTVGA